MTALHHLRLNLSDLSRSRAFYGPILRWLGFRELDPHSTPDGGVDRYRWEKEGFVFLLSKAGSRSRHDRTAVGLHHLAFAVPSRGHVDAFYWPQRACVEVRLEGDTEVEIVATAAKQEGGRPRRAQP